MIIITKDYDYQIQETMESEFKPELEYFVFEKLEPKKLESLGTVLKWVL